MFNRVVAISKSIQLPMFEVTGVSNRQLVDKLRAKSNIIINKNVTGIKDKNCKETYLLQPITLYNIIIKHKLKSQKDKIK